MHAHTGILHVHPQFELMSKKTNRKFMFANTLKPCRLSCPWQIRTLEMLKSRFRSLSGAFNANLVSATDEDLANSRRQGFSLRKSYRPLDELYREHEQSAEISHDEESQLLEVVRVDYNPVCQAFPASPLFLMMLVNLFRTLQGNQRLTLKWKNFPNSGMKSLKLSVKKTTSATQR